MRFRIRLKIRFRVRIRVRIRVRFRVWFRVRFRVRFMVRFGVRLRFRVRNRVRFKVLSRYCECFDSGIYPGFFGFLKIGIFIVRFFFSGISQFENEFLCTYRVEKQL